MDLANSTLPERISARRRELGMSKADLAEKAGLSVKVVHQIETGARQRFLEKTILLIAAALDTTLDELMRPEEAPQPIEADPPTIPEAFEIPPAPARRRQLRPRLIIAVATIAVLLATVPALVALNRPVPIPGVTIAGPTVVAAEAQTGKELWSRSFEATVWLAEPSPWRDGTVLVGLGCDAPDGGRLLLLHGRTGATIWDRTADVDLAARAFGTAILAGLGDFSPMFYRPVDLFGDGQLQIAVSFIHVRNYPGSVVILDREGTVVGEYMNRGHVYAILAADIDHDGRQELICGGANNNTQFSGGAVFILDHEHCRGAAVDPHNGGNLEVTDGARRRVLLPSFGDEILGWLGTERTSVDHLLASKSLEGSTTIIARMGHGPCILHVMFDVDLNPLGALPTDTVRRCVAGWPVEDPDRYGPNCPQWRAQWLQGSVSLGAAPQPSI